MAPWKAEGVDDDAIPPRLLVALALVAAAGLVVLAEVVTIATISSPDLGAAAGVGLLDRIRLGTRLADLPVLLTLPLAVLLARLVEPGAARSPVAAARAVLAGATSVGSALFVLVVLRVLADLGARELVLDPRPKLAALLVNLASLVVASTGTGWAWRELQRTPRAAATSSAPPPSMPAPSVPPPRAGGFPAGPPPSPPPAQAPDWGRSQHRQ